MESIKTEALPQYKTSEPGGGESPEVTALVERAKEGDGEAFGDLMRLYERRIIAIGVQMGLSRDDAQDACQDAFTKVFKHIKRFRSGHSFFRWLYRIAIHAVYDHLRWVRRPATMSLEDLPGGGAEGIESPEGSLQSRIESSDLARKVLDCLDDLSRRERIVFILRDIQQIPTSEIGQILQLSQVTVRRHCMSARRKLREKLLPRPESIEDRTERGRPSGGSDC